MKKANSCKARISADPIALHEPAEINGKIYTHAVLVALSDPKTGAEIRRIGGWYACSEDDAIALANHVAGALARAPANQPLKFNFQDVTMATATVEWPCLIHDDDVARAIRAKLMSGGTSKVAIKKLRDFFLDSIANPPSGELSESQIKSILGSRKDKSLMEAVTRALGEGRKPFFSKLENAILQGWREVIINGESMPGFREWKPLAAGALLERVGIIPASRDHAGVFVDARKALGLSPLPFKVRSFSPSLRGRQFSRTDCVISMKTGENKTVIVPRK